MRRILSVSSSRADVGALAPVWGALVDDPGIELHVFLTGMHMANDEAARAALPRLRLSTPAAPTLGALLPAAAAAAMARIETDAAALLAKSNRTWSCHG